MKTNDIVTIFKVGISLPLNTGIIMNYKEQSIAIIKREDKRGVYYSINDRINGVAQKEHHDECLMTLLSLNSKRFKHRMYNSRISNFN
jgi:hypothetical protein